MPDVVQDFELKAEGQEPSKLFSFLSVGETTQMFAKHNPLKPNHALAYRVFGQTFLCPAGVQEQRSMIQTEPITSNHSSMLLGWQSGRDFLLGRLDGTRLEGTMRIWRQGGSLDN